jgi:Beta-lactamase
MTLGDLATHRSGLPQEASGDYNPAKLKTFLAAYQLPRDPGAAYEYSNLGFALLGYTLAQMEHIEPAKHDCSSLHVKVPLCAATARRLRRHPVSMRRARAAAIDSRSGAPIRSEPHRAMRASISGTFDLVVTWTG